MHGATIKNNNSSNIHGATIKNNNRNNMHGATIKTVMVTICTMQQ